VASRSLSRRNAFHSISLPLEDSIYLLLSRLNPKVPVTGDATDDVNYTSQQFDAPQFQSPETDCRVLGNSLCLGTPTKAGGDPVDSAENGAPVGGSNPKVVQPD
jgi:hypothetical protein